MKIFWNATGLVCSLLPNFDSFVIVTKKNISGIVRSVELGNNKVYLLPSIPAVDLQYVNTLAVCSIPLPTAILINQSAKIAGCVPYVYSSDNFIGSKQIVPITYRPDKQMSKYTKKLV